MKKFLKYFLLIIILLFIAIQFYPKPPKNTGASVNDISKVHNIPPNVKSILETSCYDCHSNNTRYPWYNNLQPVALWMGNHIKDGKKELNFSEYATYSIRKKFKKLEEIGEQVKKGEMPLASYTLIHRNAILDSEKKKILEDWASAIHDSIRFKYPADSLVIKK
ncbi:MAG TPA: heme-binding domain-containing protein [Ferruginibacter sp.]|nr:heme-binding domain-containing protein [Ferruginibacter sp.]